MPVIRDIISIAVPVPPSASIVEVAWKMMDAGTSVVAVCSNNVFLGLITEKDIVLSIIANAYNPKRIRVRSLLKDRQPSVSPDTTITHAAKEMIDHNTQALPVIEKEKLLGLITLGDLAKLAPEMAATVLSQTSGPHGYDETKLYQSTADYSRS